jgi:hypothetical protein
VHATTVRDTATARSLHTERLDVRLVGARVGRECRGSPERAARTASSRCRSGRSNYREHRRGSGPPDPLRFGEPDTSLRDAPQFN